MTDLRSTLERIGDRAPVPGPAFERLVHRRAQRRRRQRIVASVVAVAVFAAVALASYVLIRREDMSQQPFHTTSLTKSGWVVFAARAGGRDLDLYVAPPGETVRRVVGNQIDTYSQRCSAWSPDGAFLAYTDEAFLKVVRVDASGVPGEQVTAIARADVSSPCPVWAPTGATLAWATSNLGHGHIETLAVDGTGATPGMSDAIPKPVPGASFAWSPDGSMIAVLTEDGLYLAKITEGYLLDGVKHGFVLRLDAGHRWPINTGDLSVSWSPDGSAIAVAGLNRGGVLRIVDVTDGTSYDIDAGSACCGPTSPAWSPDGGRIAYITDGGIESMKPGGTERRELQSFTVPGFGNGAVVPVSNLHWSTDGTRFLFVGNAGGSYGIVSVDLDGSSPLLITPSDWTDQLAGVGEGDLSLQP